MKSNNFFPFILLASSLEALLWIILSGPHLFTDSSTYFQGLHTLQNGNIDILRTPVYPIILGICMKLFGHSYLYAVICLQHLTFLISVICIRDISVHLFNNPVIIHGITLIYGVFPFLISWNNFVLTESFAVSFSVFLFYFAFRLFRRPDWKDLLAFSLCFIFILLLRPAFVYLPPIFAVAFAFLAFTKKIKSALYGLVGSLVAVICLLAYMSFFHQEYGVFASSDVSLINQYHIARENNLLTPESFENDELKKTFSDFIVQNGDSPSFSDIWDEANYLCNNFPLTDIKQGVQGIFKQFPSLFLSTTLKRTRQALKTPILVSQTSRIGGIFGFSISTLVVFLVLMTVILLFWVKCHRVVPWAFCTVLLISASALFVAFVGAQGDWGRLVVPSMPFILLLLGQFCQLINVKSMKSVLFQ